MNQATLQYYKELVEANIVGNYTSTQGFMDFHEVPPSTVLDLTDKITVKTDQESHTPMIALIVNVDGTVTSTPIEAGYINDGLVLIWTTNIKLCKGDTVRFRTRSSAQSQGVVLYGFILDTVLYHGVIRTIKHDFVDPTPGKYFGHDVATANEYLHSASTVVKVTPDQFRRNMSNVSVEDIEQELALHHLGYLPIPEDYDNWRTWSVPQILEAIRYSINDEIVSATNALEEAAKMQPRWQANQDYLCKFVELKLEALKAQLESFNKRFY